MESQDETQVFPRVTVCLDGSYCCDQDGAQCCSDKRGVFLDVTGNIAKVPASTTMSWGPERTSSGYQTVATTSATSINTSDVSTASTPAVSASSTSSPGATSQSESSNAAKIGAGVGVPVGVIAIGGVAALVILWRRKKRQTRFRNASELDSEGHHQEMVGRKPSAPTPPELEDRQVHRSELSA
ncbi:hypothetical protein QQS21_009073 [Conoideocrella luteorostrata]|uniref:Mid2 domain-containing protein n=1 Tax=Conoideocrella luteorostrata TaxID=1105319 RepID=A0AAJ0FVZ2_9HYPO|nr:hypothetical protein QQS21_009073 [Conoideocrella luteorostrata]